MGFANGRSIGKELCGGGIRNFVEFYDGWIKKLVQNATICALWWSYFQNDQSGNFLMVGLGILWWWDQKFLWKGLRILSQRDQEGGGIRKFVVMIFQYFPQKIGIAQYLAKLIISKICKSGDRILDIGKNCEPEKSAEILKVKSAKNLNF